MSDGFCANQLARNGANAAKRSPAADAAEQNFRAQGRQSARDAGDPTGSGAAFIAVAGV